MADQQSAGRTQREIIEESKQRLGGQPVFAVSGEGPMQHPLDIKCEEVRQNLSAYKKGTPELSRSLVLQISAHLLGCADCQKEHNR